MYVYICGISYKLGDSNQGLGDTCTCFSPALAACRSEMEYLGVRIYIYEYINNNHNDNNKEEAEEEEED